jgi:proteasome accessory factor A
MFDRLMGMETEYALRFHPRAPGGDRPRNATLFDRLLAAVAARVPIANAFIREFGWFTANGGAVRFERNPFFNWRAASGLVEGATPECRGPRQLLRYQRAQDALLSRAAVASGGDDGDAALLKNNQDPFGNVYGCHENYEAVLARGPGLLVWWLVIVVLPLFLLPVAMAVGLAMIVGVPLCVPAAAVGAALGGRHGALRACEVALAWALTLCLLPVMFLIDQFVRLAAFRRQRRRMLAFLVSRPVITGAGTVDAGGRFGLSPRAGAVGTLCGSAAECSRPMFYFGYLWKGVLNLMAGDWEGYKRLFWPRQRLQIASGDSNMAQVAEYLKVGTTLLVLEAIEAGEFADAPRLWFPLRAMRRLCADPDLRATVRAVWGRPWTALQLQRYYLEGCRRYVARVAPDHAEAAEVLRLWGEALDALEEDPRRMVGKLDWVTKRYLLETAGAGAPVAALRKIDVRYHELTREGYYLRLEAAGAAPTLAEPEDVLEAVGKPPENTPAALRGRLIREHAKSPELVTAGWSCVVLRTGRRRVVRLTDRRDGTA